MKLYTVNSGMLEERDRTESCPHPANQSVSNELFFFATIQMILNDICLPEPKQNEKILR